MFTRISTAGDTAHLAMLMSTGSKIVEICRAQGVDPIVYGSIACRYHTGDLVIPIHDLDLLIPDASFPAIIVALERANISFVHQPWKSVVISLDTYIIELDSLETYSGSSPLKIVSAVIEGYPLRVLACTNLSAVYQEAIDHMGDKIELAERKAAYQNKLNRLVGCLAYARESLQLAIDKSAALKLAYELLCKKYHGDRLSTFTRLYRIFYTSPTALWNRNGFLHCTQLNRLLRHLLLGSGHFTADEIRFKWTLIWAISPHEYAQVLVDGSWIPVDCWAARYGVPFGEYATGFKGF